VVAGWVAEAMHAYPELTDPIDEVAILAEGFRTPSGEKFPQPERTNYIEQAEVRDGEMLDDNWEMVERVARRAMVSLPVEREELLAQVVGEPA
jgi:hypothetical protein